LGYYAVSTCQIARDIVPVEMARKLPKDAALPAALLGRLAIDTSRHSQGLGSRLLVDALRRVQFLAERIGIVAVTVDAIDDRAVAFYLHHQFILLLNGPRHLFLPVATIRKTRPRPDFRMSGGRFAREESARPSARPVRVTTPRPSSEGPRHPPRAPGTPPARPPAALPAAPPRGCRRGRGLPSSGRAS
jgi:hypothetical protein